MIPRFPNLHRDMVAGAITLATGLIVAAAMLTGDGGAPADSPPGAIWVGTPDSRQQREADPLRPARDDAPGDPATPIARAGSDRPPAPKAGDANSPHTQAKQGAIAAPVERTPIPVDRMTDEQVRKAVNAYRQWVHQGRIALELDFGRLNRDQLNECIAAYLVQGGGAVIQVERQGRASRIEALPPGRLIGDLPRDRWPAVLESAAKEWFGPGNSSNACLILAERVELEVYRHLGQRVKPKPGTRIALALLPAREGGFDLRVLSVKPPEGED